MNLSPEVELDLARKKKIEAGLALRKFIREFMNNPNSTPEDAEKLKELAKAQEEAEERHKKAFDAVYNNWES